MKNKKEPTMRQLLKPITVVAKSRDLTLKEVIQSLKSAWGKPTEREIIEDEEDEKEFQRRVSAGLVRDRY